MRNESTYRRSLFFSPQAYSANETLEDGTVLKNVTVHEMQQPADETKVLGLALDQFAFDDAIKVFGQAIVSPSGNEGSTPATLCYLDSDGSGLLLESGAMGGWKTVHIIKLGKTLPKAVTAHYCEKSASVSKELLIGKWRLGMKRSEILKLDSKPSYRSKSRIAYRYHWVAREKKKQIEYDSGVDLMMKKDEIIEIKIYRTGEASEVPELPK